MFSRYSTLFFKKAKDVASNSETQQVIKDICIEVTAGIVTEYICHRLEGGLKKDIKKSPEASDDKIPKLK